MDNPILGYIVDAATKLFTSRKIGGVDFDGTEDIDLPGVNAPGNQNTTGNSKTSDSWKSSIDFKIKGDVKEKTVQIDGSGNVEIEILLDPSKLVGGSLVIVNELIALSPKSTIEYSISDELGSNMSKFNPSTLKIMTMVKDTLNTSPTFGFYVNSEAGVTIGISENKENIIIHNPHEVLLELMVNVTC